MIEFHGTSEISSRVSGDIRLAASPATSIARTKANSSIWSASRSLRCRPSTKRIAEFKESTMCCNRMRSSGVILHFCLAQDLVTKIAAQLRRGPQIDSPSRQQARQLLFDLRKIEITGLGAWREFHQQVNIAVRPRGALHDRSEQRQPANAVAPAEQRE